MKKCPFCKADIEDNARFCLYCMKPLNEKEIISPPQKKKQWWWLFVVVFVVLALVHLIPKNQNVPQKEAADGESSFSTQTTGPETTGSAQDSQSEDDASSEDTDGENTQQPLGTTGTNQTPVQKQAEDTKPITTPTPSTQPETPTQNTTPPAEPEGTTEETTGETTEDTTQPEPQPTSAAYNYRTARAGDDFNANYTNAGSDIVITGVSRQSSSGIYDIPAYIDGKKVIAIMANTFYGSNAKVVYIPVTVKTIWNYAFNGCSLTDVYFLGNAVYAENKAFSGSFTIHCSASCSDRNFRYYKDCAQNYGASWDEWNG